MEQWCDGHNAIIYSYWKLLLVLHVCGRSTETASVEILPDILAIATIHERCVEDVYYRRKI
jgi:hypothetical protein